MNSHPAICVFCGSSIGFDRRFEAAARTLGETLAKEWIGLVTGGGRVGLMGAIADAALSAGGRVIGVIPEPLAAKEIAHDGLTELHIVPGMHERKALMAELVDAFATLPGGIGTYEEFFEILTWGSLGLHRKPIGVLEIGRYFDPLRALLDHSVQSGFVRAADLDHLIFSNDPRALPSRLLAFEPPARTRWVDRDQI